MGVCNDVCRLLIAAYCYGLQGKRHAGYCGMAQALPGRAGRSGCFARVRLWPSAAASPTNLSTCHVTR